MLICLNFIGLLHQLVCLTMLFFFLFVFARYDSLLFYVLLLILCILYVFC